MLIFSWETAQYSFFQWLQLEPEIAAFAYGFSQYFRDSMQDKLLQKWASTSHVLLSYRIRDMALCIWLQSRGDTATTALLMAGVPPNQQAILDGCLTLTWQVWSCRHKVLGFNAIKSKNRNTNRKQGMAWENVRYNIFGMKKLRSVIRKVGKEGRECTEMHS